MNAVKRSMVVVGCCAVALMGAAIAETKVEVKKTHLCCPQCVTAVNKVLEKAGVKGAANKDDGSIAYSAADDKAAQKVLDDIAAAGFHGETGDKNIKIKDDSGVKEGKVKKLTLKGAHNCCGACTKAIKAVLKKVDGVESDDAKAKSDTITITGDFDGKVAVKALNDAGFHVTLPKEKGKDEPKEGKKDN
jgi:copper chaperone CopZ